MTPITLLPNCKRPPLRLARELKPDIILLDLDMPGLNGLDFARAHRREELGGELIFLTMYKEADVMHEALDLGAKGYVLKESAAADILACIHAVAEGRHYISPSLSSMLMARRSGNAPSSTQPPGLGKR